MREGEFFQTGHKFIPELRKRRPEPKFFLNSKDAAELNIDNGEWIFIKNKAGKIKGIAEIRDDMPKGLVRAPYSWWKPETKQGKDFLSSALKLSDAQLTIEEEGYISTEQGIPHLRGLPCRVEKA